MPNKDTPYQTIGEFLDSPFGNKRGYDTEKLEKKFLEFNGAKKFYCENWSEDSDMYLIHIKIPSESQEGRFYDVVIQFFTDDNDISKQNSLEKYYIQFFSNSPSFIYKYAALYKVHGYLIDSLYDKMDQEYSNMLPDKANPNYDMSWDKSIYFACRFLKANAMTILRKPTLKLFKHVPLRTLIKSIKGFEETMADAELFRLEQDVKKETAKEKNIAKEQRKALLRKVNPFSHFKDKIKAKDNTLSEDSPKSVTIKKPKAKKKATTFTSTDGTKRSVHVIKKKR